MPQQQPYHPESYWNEVAKRIASRTGRNVVAGDDEPFYRYKRSSFLKLFHSIEFTDKVVLELGSGPGGNLLELISRNPKEVHGVDISHEMVALSTERLSGTNATIKLMQDDVIPYASSFFDLSFTSTVLQHTTDESRLLATIAELCRVTKSDIYIFERIENRIKGDELNLGRPVSYYERLFSQREFGLKTVRFLNVHVSYLVSGAIRKLFNSRNRKEGEPATVLSTTLQRLTLPITKTLDKVVPVNRELAMLHFKKG